MSNYHFLQAVHFKDVLKKTLKDLVVIVMGKSIIKLDKKSVKSNFKLRKPTRKF